MREQRTDAVSSNAKATQCKDVKTSGERTTCCNANQLAMNERNAKCIRTKEMHSKSNEINAFQIMDCLQIIPSPLESLGRSFSALYDTEIKEYTNALEKCIFTHAIKQILWKAWVLLQEIFVHSSL